MKYAGLLVMPAGFFLSIAAILLFPSSPQRAAVCIVRTGGGSDGRWWWRCAATCRFAEKIDESADSDAVSRDFVRNDAGTSAAGTDGDCGRGAGELGSRPVAIGGTVVAGQPGGYFYRCDCVCAGGIGDCCRDERRPCFSSCGQGVELGRCGTAVSQGFQLCRATRATRFAFRTSFGGARCSYSVGIGGGSAAAAGGRGDRGDHGSGGVSAGRALDMGRRLAGSTGSELFCRGRFFRRRRGGGDSCARGRFRTGCRVDRGAAQGEVSARRTCRRRCRDTTWSTCSWGA